MINRCMANRLMANRPMINRSRTVFTVYTCSYGFVYTDGVLHKCIVHSVTEEMCAQKPMDRVSYFQAVEKNGAAHEKIIRYCECSLKEI